MQFRKLQAEISHLKSAILIQNFVFATDYADYTDFLLLITSKIRNLKS